MNEQSTALPSEWIERLFQRFQVIYGNRVQQMWGDVPFPQVLELWRSELAHWTGDDMREALEAMRFAYKDFPPNLYQFSDLCRDAMKRRTQTVKRLNAPRGGEPIDAEALAQIHTLTQRMVGGPRDPKDWARKIIQREADGERVPMVAAQFAREALGMA